MGGKNFMAKKMRQEKDDAFLDGINKGIRIGIQFNNDIYQCLLNNAEIMGKDTFGEKRLEKLHHGAEDMCDEFEPALFGVTNPEADVYRAKLDARLKKALGTLFQPWPVRYPDLVECSYEGRKKK